LTPQDIRADIVDYIVNELLDGDDSIDVAEQENLLLNGTLDSLGVVRLVAHLESVTGRRIPHEDITLDNFKTVDAITGYLTRESH